MKKFSFKLVGKSFKDAFSGFGNDKVTKLSASLAYYTGFSLAPLLVVIIAICGFFFGAEAVQGSIQTQMQSFIGADAAKQIQDMIKNAAISGKGTLATIIGAVTLLIGASSIFAEIQDSINSIWGLKAKPKAGIMRLVKSRLLSFGLIASLGFLLLVSLAATTVVESLGNRLKAALPDVTVVLFYVINLVLTLGVTTVLFAVIFKVLPDAKIKWKAVWPGAIVTSLLFLIGKFAISLYISKTNVGSTYGAAGSLAVIFVWIYYSSIILYFGAEFTKAYTINKGAKVVPSQYAEWSQEPTVPNAEPKSPPPSSPSPEKERRQPLPAHPQLAVSHPRSDTTEALDNPRAEHKRKEPGVGTVLLGLALYFVANARSKKQHG
ncbi:YihY/virulence factor BrkB family protein [Flavisolibacter ginsenosidimutans]|uniref:YihY/virulence factor BrkB family protein n=1 Tax=Flavisolibacter ginsenosidimutans TaxID=661481 RepID=A0A5B8UM91_9BACT|nr:YihY/virulence factor BrkB family protein [Flavisolibacter ginsenosidimutans]QEC57787.1 YihY/virulence factor BrkB family protein [Flavisolibacter ginsenosidimutans]